MLVSPTVLIGDIVTALRAIPGLMTLLDNTPANVIDYSQSYPAKMNVSQAAERMNPPSVMVAHANTQFGRNIEHLFSIYLKPRGSPDEMLLTIREGVPAGYGGEKFKRARINIECGAPMILRYGPIALFIGEQSFINLHEIQLSLMQRGADI